MFFRQEAQDPLSSVMTGPAPFAFRSHRIDAIGVAFSPWPQTSFDVSEPDSHDLPGTADRPSHATTEGLGEGQSIEEK